MNWRDAKEFYTELIRDNKVNMFFLRAIMVSLLVLAAVIIYRCISEPVNLWGLELNKDRIIHDTIVIRDTVNIYISKGPSDNKTVPGSRANTTSNQQTGGITANQINITSHDQKGGQTAAQINN